MNDSATWNLTEAQKKFVQLIQAVRENPQLITDDQGKVVAAVIEIETFQKFINWNQQEKQQSVGDAFATLHQICAEENYTLETPKRLDRPDPFIH
ncbi:prevent-host-death protein [Capilliphycus salinus ALCB114379]|uniref:prevent-host-death protein n=1 Tax=Capilliphycus salinus TaxID=2768948 RepID=UPI0039A63BE0